jgi:hypothetical protein
VYRFGWHSDLWDAGINRQAVWHSACVAAWRLWNAPSDHDRLLRRLQARRCAQTGGRLWTTAEIDHRVPLFQVWRERRDTPWPELLAYWGLPNLQVISRRPRRQMRGGGAVSRGNTGAVIARVGGRSSKRRSMMESAMFTGCPLRGHDIRVCCSRLDYAASIPSAFM